MSPSRNRGKKKPKLRDYSNLVLTGEEKQALHAVAESGDQQPIVTAILGCVLVEHELDVLLRAKLKKRDDETWRSLTDERGPFRSFSTKITMGHALGIYDDKIRNDLDLVRTIRNAFAHSRKLLDFNDPLIVAELSRSLLLKENFKRYLHEDKDGSNRLLTHAFYVIICLKLETMMLRRQALAGRAKLYRAKKKGPNQSAFRNALLNSLMFNPYAPHPDKMRIADLGSSPPPSQGDQSEHLNPAAPQGLFSGLSAYLAEQAKKKK